MEAFVRETGRAVVIPNDNINTDIILPKQFLKNILKTGFGKDLFYDWRYNADGSLNESFELNKPEHEGASILITGNDFGSGSSREHAVWALTDYGFRAVIGGGFSDIFYMNSTKNGLLPIVLPEENRKILRNIQADENIQIDLPEQTVTYKNYVFHFDINSQWKEKFINGEDDIDNTMKYEKLIAAFEKQRPNFG
ncbi:MULTISPECIES: 3-isopropylmalate dehydratase small subunit [Leuconostoc]|uniref:3-isopropylmalate dehydratase small subunit n=1 Tax=Leuconostoc suionicum TaxID=1511761 RepID=A0A2N9KEK9_9LACO|nr:MULTISPECIES: 3-isopropylmalate dehydratase small subunit [Leuconostoc]API72944.1 3-isopropylmalate dehydratase small subunit [Leuconostoc suionicum]MBE4726804.1 3-isopropylmalate dehydratase small subunit [Leuconostoc suionicum]MCT4402819.1 3-isopropylmalate dehydratase small subunit [Leuconostoc suionicum]MDI6523167.1 3-isopropylmalate dehydratase small subunit [Leuconostoc suionicum]MDI6544446.1 3-isopropylmalate dehydratase small subunit [Leuconostoc suionicum]